MVELSNFYSNASALMNLRVGRRVGFVGLTTHVLAMKSVAVIFVFELIDLRGDFFLSK